MTAGSSISGPAPIERRAERELKLKMAPQQLAQLRGHELMRMMAKGRLHERNLVSTYYDTPAHDLHHQAAALRIRQVEGKRIQTLKMPRQAADAAAGRNGRASACVLQDHTEIECELARQDLNLDMLSDSSVPCALNQPEIRSTLLPIFRTEIQRESQRLIMTDSEIEICIDHGAIVSDDRSEEVCEVELELVSGQPSRLFELALLISQAIHCTVEPRTKAARGYGLLSRDEPSSVKVPLPELLDDASVYDAVAAMSSACLDQMVANEAAVMDGKDAEGVHLFRVAVRRLRSLLSLFKHFMEPASLGYLRAELRWLQQELGGARDCDVFLLETLEPLIARYPKEPGLVTISQAVLHMKDGAYRRARTALQSTRYTQLLLRLQLWSREGGWFDQGNGERIDPHQLPVQDFARTSLERRTRYLRKKARRAPSLEIEALHELRILAKKLRYACEFFRGPFPKKKAKRFVATLVDLQDCLGSLNEVVVSQKLIGSVDIMLAANKHDQRERGAGIILGWQAARLEADLKTLDGRWSAFCACKPFWTHDDGS